MAEKKALVGHAIFGLLALGVIGAWLILLGGLSAVQKSCNGGCRAVTGLAWWIVWFQFFALALMAAVQFVPSLSFGRPAVLTLLAILTALEMFLCDKAFTDRDNLSSPDSTYTNLGIGRRRLNAVAVGFLLLSALNLMLILFMGTAPPTGLGGSGSTGKDDENVRGSGPTNTSTASSGMVYNLSNNGPPVTGAHNMRPMHANKPPKV